jgi:hypothetical protein
MSRAVFQSTLGGSTTLDAEQTADTKTLVIPAADGTLVYTDDAGVASFDDISLTGAVIAGAWDGDTIDVAHGGTGAVTLTGYVKGAGTTALTASATIPNSDITGLGTMSTQNASAVAITGGTISGLGTPLAVPSGGSGAATLTGYVIGNGTSAMTASATIPNTDITGLGNMSVQDSDAVTITGGTANGLTIGNSTPAAVTATTLRVNSTVSLAGNTGTTGQVLTSNGGSAPTWESVSGTGDVVGPASATDNAVTRYDTTTGKLLQNSVVIIDDTGSVTGVNALTAQSLTVNNNATLGSSNTDNLAVNARITTDLDPETNNAKDIGTSGRNWRDGFFGRTLHTVNLELTGTTSFDGSQGTSGQVLQSNGSGTTPSWVTPAGGVTLANDTSTATNLYPTFANATTGSVSTIYTGDAKLLYKPSTGELQSTTLVASNGLIVNNMTVASNYTVDTGFSASSVGPITVNSGIAVTVNSGSRWVVL